MRIIKILIVVFFVLDIFLIYKVTIAPEGFYDYSKLKKIKRKYEKNIEDIHRENVKLSKEIELIKKDREFQEKVIRKKLRLGKKNEVLYIISDSRNL